MLLVTVMVSASLDCRDEFNVVAVGERRGGPLAARHHLGVVRDGHAEFLRRRSAWPLAARGRPVIWLTSVVMEAPSATACASPLRVMFMLFP